MLTILLEWLSGLISSADDVFKGIVALATFIFSGGKLYDFIQKIREGNNKVEEAKINADKEIQTNRDKHNAEVERLKDTINHKANEIKLKDDLIVKHEENVREYKRKYEECFRINEAKDTEIKQLYERLQRCTEDKKRK